MKAADIHRRPWIRWIFIIGVLVAIPISIYVARWARNGFLTQLHDRARDDLNVNIAYMKSRIDNLFTITNIVSSDDRVLDLLQHPHDRRKISTVNHLLARFNVTAGTFAYILDMKGVVIASGNWEAPDSFVGKNYSFRPYFRSSLLGDAGQYVAIGVTSKRLGYYIALPIRVNGRISAVAVTKTDPQDLVLANAHRKRLFFITDSNGVTIISHPDKLQFHSLKPLHRSVIERMQRRQQYTGVTIKSLTDTPIKTLGRVRVMTMSAPASVALDLTPQQYVLSSTTVPTAGWTAHILWPVRNLTLRIVQSLLMTFLVLMVTLLLVLFAVVRWQHIKQMHWQAIRDPLTGLYTRLYMLESATSMLASHDRNNIPGVGAIMFDLDHFKRINDQYGHSAGDHVLVKVSAIVLKECRDSDIPIRYGGEELLIFMPSGEETQVLQMAERIRTQVKKLDISLAGHCIHVTLSGGFALHLEGESLEMLIDRADRRMYRAKQRGRDQIFREPESRVSGQNTCE